MPQSILIDHVKVEGTVANEPLPTLSNKAGSIKDIYFQTNSQTITPTKETKDKMASKMASSNTAHTTAATTTAKKAVPILNKNKEHKQEITTTTTTNAATTILKKDTVELAIFEDTDLEEEMVRTMVMREESLEKERKERLDICAKLSKLAREKGRKKAEKEEKERKEQEEIQTCLEYAALLEDWIDDTAKVTNPDDQPVPTPQAKMPEGAEACWGMPGSGDIARQAAILPKCSAANTTKTARELKEAKKVEGSSKSLEMRRKEARRSSMSTSRAMSSSPSPTRPSEQHPTVAALISQFGRGDSPGKLPTTRPASAQGCDVPKMHNIFPHNENSTIENPANAPITLETLSLEKRD